MATNVKIYQKEPNLAVIVKLDGEDVNIEKATKRGITKIGTKKEKKKTKPSRIAWIAASCIVFAAITAKVAYNLSTPWGERIYKKYYAHYESNPFTLDGDYDFEQAIKNYKTGKTKDAWCIIKNLNENYSRKKSLSLYKALILMDGKSYRLAIESFDNLLRIPENGDFVPIAGFYKGLCYMRTDNVSGAKGEFAKIEKEDINFYEKSQKIIKRIDRHNRWVERREKLASFFTRQ